jgi:aldehyde:ferredoxin oxidoreductase
LANGYAGKILHVDLTKRKGIKKEPLDMEFAKKYMGGKGFGARLLYDMVPAKVDPFSPQNPVIFCTGPLTGTMAQTNRYCIVTKSPLTGLFSDSYAGGDFSPELKYAGYDIVVIRGKSPKPVYLWIDDGNVELRSAKGIWGLDTYETQDRILEELGDKSIKVACIGPAGEKRVRFALVDSSPHRQAGRCGTGAVMGSKNLKAVAVRGSGKIEIAEPKAFDEAYWKSREEIEKSADALTYRKGGTPAFVGFANSQGLYPTRNFYDGVNDKVASALDDVAQRKYLWLREYGCMACAIHCTKIGKIRRACSEQGPIKCVDTDIIEYETTGLMGGSCDINLLEAVAYSTVLCDKYGMDSISAGNIVGWTMECYEKGILKKKDLGGLEAKFGSWKSQIELIKMMGERRGIGRLLGEGVARASKAIGKGSEEFAIHIKKMETPAWPPRGSPGQAIALACSDRGCDHQRGFMPAYEVGGYSWPFGGPFDRLSIEAKKSQCVKWEQDHLSALYSLTVCEFSRSGIQNDTFAALLSAATGWKIDYSEMLKYGERVWNLIRMFNVREGITRTDDSAIPKRFKEPLPSGPAKGHKITDEDFNKLLDWYYEARGWDKNGIPTKTKLTELGLEDLTKGLKK